jgi:acyl phosphate:glycerol-3-phosphate acyltransferase
MSTLPAYAAALAFGYLLGSIPFGLIFTRLAGTQDVRTLGSGSIGATNVLRTGRKGIAAATLLGDVLKGTVAVLVARRYGHDAALLAGLGAFLGHLFPVWLKFRGGKGVATFIGILLAFSWQAVLGFGAIWLALAAATRYSSLASLLACSAAPPMLWWLDLRREAMLFALLTVLVWIMHRANLARLAGGTESRIGQKAAAPGPEA